MINPLLWNETEDEASIREKINGTLQERVKVQRRWKSIKTPIAEGMRIHYNFVKLHIALDGQTPAEVSGISVQARNKWEELIKQSVIKKINGKNRDQQQSSWRASD